LKRGKKRSELERREKRQALRKGVARENSRRRRASDRRRSDLMLSSSDSLLFSARLSFPFSILLTLEGKGLGSGVRHGCYRLVFCGLGGGVKGRRGEKVRGRFIIERNFWKALKTPRIELRYSGTSKCLHDRLKPVNGHPSASYKRAKERASGARDQAGETSRFKRAQRANIKVSSMPPLLLPLHALSAPLWPRSAREALPLSQQSTPAVRQRNREREEKTKKRPTFCKGKEGAAEADAA